MYKDAFKGQDWNSDRMKIVRQFLCWLVVPFIVLSPLLCEADEELPGRETLRLGFIGSLSGFASSYGTAVLEGATLAAEKLAAAGARVELITEDDQSASRHTVTAYTKLRTIDKIQGLIGGTWWANAIAKQTEGSHIPFLSCETLYDKDFVKAKTYFSLGGDLREWVRVYEPLVKLHNFQTGATVRFSSGFADTIAAEMDALFSKDDRKYLGQIEYSDIQMNEAGTIATRIKRIRPQVLYIDAQPQSFSTLMKRLNELKISSTTVFTNSIAEDALNQKLIKSRDLKIPVYFTKRSSYRPNFKNRFRERYGREPVLNSDLGYYAVHVLYQAFKMGGDTVDNIKGGTLQVRGLNFTFDENNVWNGISQNLWTVRNGKIAQVDIG